jgi:UDP-N-acetylglucosamine--N-acetylmuramyl-(pentapeptide) pyrophosphoryl-undecaprenol N-acetylglucosamine transferase
VRIALTGGGTGGHILPAMAVLDALRASSGPDLDVRWFGPGDRGERAQVERFGLAFESVPAAGVRGHGPLRLVKSFARLGSGTLTAFRKLRRYRPDAVFSTGGYGSFPCSVAARLLGKPLVVFLPDVAPGWAVKAEKKLATRMATTTEAALAFLPQKKTVVTGYPVRRAFFEQTRQEARRALGISEAEKVVVIAGATQGARAINTAVFGELRTILANAMVFHVTGPADFAEATGHQEALGTDLADRYRVAPFRDDLPAVMLAADLGVMRAGASTLGEIPAAGLPAILVPGTYAGGHQRQNAQWLVDGGAAEILEEAELDKLSTRILALLGDEAKLARMRSSAQAMAKPGAAGAIAKLVIEVASQ